MAMLGLSLVGCGGDDGEPGSAGCPRLLEHRWNPPPGQSPQRWVPPGAVTQKGGAATENYGLDLTT